MKKGRKGGRSQIYCIVDSLPELYRQAGWQASIMQIRKVILFFLLPLAHPGCSLLCRSPGSLCVCVCVCVCVSRPGLFITARDCPLKDPPAQLGGSVLKALQGRFLGRFRSLLLLRTLISHS